MKVIERPVSGARAGGAVPVTALLVVAALGIGALAVARFATQAQADEPSARVLTVNARPAEQQQAYTVERVFVGRVEATRRSAVGFELAGRLEDVAVDEGDRVAAGDPLALLDTDRLQARRREQVAALAQVKADLKLAETTLARTEEAIEFNGVSAQEVDEARERQRSLAAAVRVAESRLNTVDIEITKSRLEAPYDALVVRRFADEGQVLAAGSPVLELVEIGPLEVRVGVAGEAIDEVAAGATHEVEIRGRRYDANVTAVLAVRDPGSRTVDVILELPGDDARVRPGDLARLILSRSVDEAGFWMPVGSLTEGRRGLWAVYVAEPVPPAERGDDDATHRLARRTVEVLYQDSGRVYLRGGLRDGDPVVVDGLQRVVAGQGVRVDDVALARDGEPEPQP